MQNKEKNNLIYKFEFINITKKFLNGKIVANNNINLGIEPSKVTALVGENGSGKSTLTSILFGLYKQDTGEIKIDGKVCDMYQSGAAKKHRIGMVHQHFHLVEKFTVLENIILGQEELSISLDEKEIHEERISQLEEKYNSFFYKNKSKKEQFEEYYNLKIILRNKRFLRYRNKLNISKIEQKIKNIENSNKLKYKISKTKKEQKINKIKQNLKQEEKSRESLNLEILNLEKEVLKLKTKSVLQIEELRKELDFLKIDLKTRNSSKYGILNYKKYYQRFEAITQRYGINLNPDQLVSKLSVGDRQKVEILKTLWVEKEVIIFDEATATLSIDEINSLLSLIKKLKEANKTILFISHKLQEVKTIADNIAILKKGNLIALEKNTKKITIEEIAKMMVGTKVILEFKKNSPIEKKLLEVKNLTYITKKGFKAVDNISFDIKEGEIFGLAGIEGNGQEEIFNCIAGIKKPTKDSIISFQNQNIKDFKIKTRNQFISHIPIDRFKHGIIADRSLAFNSIITNFNDQKFAKFYFEGKKNQDNYKNPKGKNLIINNKAIYDWTDKLIKKMNVDGANNLNIEIRNLSGGNQQKFVIAREILKEHKLLLAGHPTRGLDIKSIKHIYTEIINNSPKKATLLYSLEISELISVCDRIAILYKGKIVNIIDPRNYDLNKISKMFVGEV
ncbi:ATP-binding cassette domain-containing protein [Candidatus Hepatoplasma crinochetorum]|uniref:Galactose/methyl galactoside import ATP-binding protein MglA n=1 Tax=Candidatus Hepatoplasma crinochetorum Av TaxID=1427984 RepID=W8GNR4_9MOLU|nr:ATP-binding cassette domain-containing protein [Candidatus Hepatoplasma crinochetorum]AHK22676.1 Galactose/methyl galactoside import ATP-binding protein MglA [Candidatus Hepatoplasma crinochetorum Av]BDV03250.1 MAG: hypothetical protein HCTKY_5440 [Candidatus Hepatoplasma crinochetorum]